MKTYNEWKIKNEAFGFLKTKNTKSISNISNNFSDHRPFSFVMYRYFYDEILNRNVLRLDKRPYLMMSENIEFSPTLGSSRRDVFELITITAMQKSIDGSRTLESPFLHKYFIRIDPDRGDVWAQQSSDARDRIEVRFDVDSANKIASEVNRMAGSNLISPEIFKKLESWELENDEEDYTWT